MAPEAQPRRFAVSLHDVAPATLGACRALLELVPPHVPITLLVVPEYHHGTPADADPAFVAFLRERVARGDDIVLHGYFHQDDAPSARNPIAWLRRRFYTASEGEFDSIDQASARRRLHAGRTMLEGLRLPPSGFIAPAWLLGVQATRAVAELGFAYTSGREWLARPQDGVRVVAPSLVASSRAGWRRLASWLVITSRQRLLSRAPFVRVALHPGDAQHPLLCSRWRQTIGWLAGDRRAVLERDVILGPSAA